MAMAEMLLQNPAAVRDARRAAGLNAHELAELADVHWTHIYRIERGARSARAKTLRAIARACSTPARRVTMADLLAEDEGDAA